MTQINNNDYYWQYLLKSMSQDNNQISALESRLTTDSDEQYASDMGKITSLEADESSLYSSLSEICPDEARADLTQLGTDLKAQKANIANFAFDRKYDPVQFAWDATHGRDICMFNISPDISKLKQDN